ncbi:transposase [Orrella sp. NBD-18]|uniref:Transposase n=1 Tax=Sheuella amnicola TaxID=2707330 RepID=A0A6B2R2E6_9BURK|nr:transposase [Sheuella amnicola]
MDDTKPEPLPPAKRSRRKFTLAFKQNLVRESLKPNVSSAEVAMSHGINPNQLKRWAREYRLLHGHPASSESIPVLLPIQITQKSSHNLRSDSMSHLHDQGSIEIRINNSHVMIVGRVDSETLRIALETLRS